MDQPNITPKSLTLFLYLADLASSWSGTPLLEISAQQRGNLTQLKKAGLLSTFKDDGCEWVRFSEEGKALASHHHGIEIVDDEY